MRKYNFYFVITAVSLAALLILHGCSDGSRVQLINDKPVERTPLVGAAINEGIKLVGQQNTYVVQFRPEYEVTVYPNPHTRGDKIIIDKATNTLYLYKKGE